MLEVSSEREEEERKIGGARNWGLGHVNRMKNLLLCDDTQVTGLDILIGRYGLE